MRTSCMATPFCRVALTGGSRVLVATRTRRRDVGTGQCRATTILTSHDAAAWRQSGRCRPAPPTQRNTPASRRWHGGHRVVGGLRSAGGCRPPRVGPLYAALPSGASLSTGSGSDSPARAFNDMPVRCYDTPIRSSKMHGIGNNYAYVNGFAETVADP